MISTTSIYDLLRAKVASSHVIYSENICFYGFFFFYVLLGFCMKGFLCLEELQCPAAPEGTTLYKTNVFPEHTKMLLLVLAVRDMEFYCLLCAGDLSGSYAEGVAEMCWSFSASVMEMLLRCARVATKMLQRFGVDV